MPRRRLALSGGVEVHIHQKHSRGSEFNHHRFECVDGAPDQHRNVWTQATTRDPLRVPEVQPEIAFQ